MKVSSVGLSLIKKWEGFYTNAYLCPAKVWTVGYGTTKWENGSPVKKGDTITQAVALQLLEKQVNEHAASITQYVKVPLTQNQFDALASFQYNLGKHILSKDPALVRYLNNKDWANATRVMKLYNKASGEVLKGLVNRRNDEVELFLKTSQTSVQDGTENNDVIKARNIIRKAVKEGVFTSPHEKVDNYTDRELLKYVIIYLERKIA